MKSECWNSRILKHDSLERKTNQNFRASYFSRLLKIEIVKTQFGPSLGYL